MKCVINILLSIKMLFFETFHRKKWHEYIHFLLKIKPTLKICSLVMSALNTTHKWPRLGVALPKPNINVIAPPRPTPPPPSQIHDVNTLQANQ